MFSSNTGTIPAFFLGGLRQRQVSIRIHAALLDVATSFLQQIMRPRYHESQKITHLCLKLMT
jgi:hypothetical protein